jgi:hypothetical protein
MAVTTRRSSNRTSAAMRCALARMSMMCDIGALVDEL